jgi:hypothetical protein
MSVLRLRLNEDWENLNLAGGSFVFGDPKAVKCATHLILFGISLNILGVVATYL